MSKIEQARLNKMSYNELMDIYKHASKGHIYFTNKELNVLFMKKLNEKKPKRIRYKK